MSDDSERRSDAAGGWWAQPGQPRLTPLRNGSVSRPAPACVTDSLSLWSQEACCSMQQSISSLNTIGSYAGFGAAHSSGTDDSGSNGDDTGRLLAALGRCVWLCGRGRGG